MILQCKLFVNNDGRRFAIAFEVQPLTVNAMFGKVVDNGFGTSIRKFNIESVGTNHVGVRLNADGDMGVVVEHLDKRIKGVLGFGSQGVLGEIKEDVVDWDGLKHGREGEVLGVTHVFENADGREFGGTVEVPPAGGEQDIVDTFVKRERVGPVTMDVDAPIGTISSYDANDSIWQWLFTEIEDGTGERKFDIRFAKEIDMV